jgi:hypothetical protein
MDKRYFAALPRIRSPIDHRTPLVECPAGKLIDDLRVNLTLTVQEANELGIGHQWVSRVSVTEPPLPQVLLGSIIISR